MNVEKQHRQRELYINVTFSHHISLPIRGNPIIPQTQTIQFLTLSPFPPYCAETKNTLIPHYSEKVTQQISTTIDAELNWRCSAQTAKGMIFLV